MPFLIKLFILLIPFTLSGCQLLTKFKPSLSHTQDPEYSVEKQVNQKMNQDLGQLFSTGIEYSRLPKAQQQLICKQLKNEHKTQNDWKTAWLLTSSLNSNFNCISLPKALSLLKSIQAALEPTHYLYWQNKNKIQLLKNLSRLKSKNKNIRQKNHDLKQKLNETEVQLQDIISKIQALKVIETTINQKTQ